MEPAAAATALDVLFEAARNGDLPDDAAATTTMVASAGDKRDRAGAPQPKAAPKHKDETTSPAVVRKWDFADRLFGFNKALKRTVDETLSARDERHASEVKRALDLLSSRLIVCNNCGDQLKSHKGTIMSHLASSACASKSGTVAKDGVAGSCTWAGKKILLMATTTRTCFGAAGGGGGRSHADTQQRLTTLLGGIFSSYGVSFQAQGELFGTSSAIRVALGRLGTHGGLHDSWRAAEHTHDAIKLIEREVIKPQIARAIALGLKLSIGADESPARGLKAPVLLVQLYAACFAEPLTVGIISLRVAPNAERLVVALKDVVIGEGFLTAQEFTDHVVIFFGDHAAYVRAAAELMGLVFCGDAAHALDLCMKDLIHGSRVMPLLVAIRSVLKSKSYEIARVKESFELPKNVASAPTHRWGYWATLVRFLSVPRCVAQLQQFVIYLLDKEKLAPLPLDLTDVSWMRGLPFAAGVDEATEDYESDGDDEVMSDVEEEELPKSAAARKARALILRQIMLALTSPKILTAVRVCADIMAPLRSAQVTLQSSSGLNPEIVTALRRALTKLEVYVDSDVSYAAAIERCSGPLVQAKAAVAPITLCVTVARRQDRAGEHRGHALSLHHRRRGEARQVGGRLWRLC